MLLKIAVAAGEVPVGQTVALIGEEGEEVAGSAGRAQTRGPRRRRRPARRRHAPTRTFRAAISGARGAAAASRPRRSRGGWRASAASTRALTGTGPDGRIVAEDVERGLAAQRRRAAGRALRSAPRRYRTVRARSSRSRSPASARTIARRLTAAWQVPVFQLTVSVDMTRANELVGASRELNPEVRVTVTDLLAKVCAQALMRHRDVNVQFTEDALLRFPTANVGIAVAAPQGLVVPVIALGRAARRWPRSPARRAELVGRARDGQAAPADLEGGTFTISNLGMFGIEQFVAVLNPPQAAILAVGATVERAGRPRRRGRGRADADDDAHGRPPRRRRRAGGRVPADREAVPRRSGARAMRAARSSTPSSAIRSAELTRVMSPGRRLDVPFLRSLLLHAYSRHVNALDTEDPLSCYVDGWGRAATRPSSRWTRGTRSAPGWYRLFGAGRRVRLRRRADPRADGRRRAFASGRGHRAGAARGDPRARRRPGLPRPSRSPMRAATPRGGFHARGFEQRSERPASGHAARRSEGDGIQGRAPPGRPGRSRGRSATRGRAPRRPPPRAAPRGGGRTRPGSPDRGAVADRDRRQRAGASSSTRRPRDEPRERDHAAGRGRPAPSPTREAHHRALREAAEHDPLVRSRRRSAPARA